MNTQKIGALAKTVASKLPVFLFCVLFMNGYNALFGTENSIVGVVLLMAMLMFLSADFACDARQVAITIPLLFVAIGLCAKLSLLHPLLGLLVNVLAIAAILLFTRGDTGRSAFLPYLMGYVMLRGYDVSGAAFTRRIISLAVLGSVIGLLYFVRSRKKAAPPLSSLLHGFSARGAWERWALVLGVTLVLVAFLGDLAHFPKSMWINLTVLSLVSSIEEGMMERKMARIPATILGCVLFFVLFECIVPPDRQMAVVLVAGFLSMFITSYFIKTIYNSFSALVTATLLMPAAGAMAVRIVCNILGVAVSALSVLLFSRIFDRMDAKRTPEA